MTHRGYGSSMSPAEDVDDQLAGLLTRRAAIAARPEDATRNAILRALNEMIVELEAGRWPDSPPAPT